MTRNSAQNRRLDVLRAIVTQYVATREPVGSKAIAAGGLGVSSATIRNDMAVLEEAGLIYQPHTSAGRRPHEADPGIGDVRGTLSRQTQAQTARGLCRAHRGRAQLH